MVSVFEKYILPIFRFKYFVFFLIFDLDNGDYSDMMLSNCETNKLIISLYQYVPPLKRNCHGKQAKSFDVWKLFQFKFFSPFKNGYDYSQYSAS